jgi:hypothetical protein
MIDLLITVLRQGQKEGVLISDVRAGVLLDFLMGFVQRTFFMWVLRGQQDSLADQANTLFEMVWRGMSNPNLQRSINNNHH